MAYNENLKPFQSAEEARENGRKGGIASGKTRREKKTIQRILNEILNTTCSDNAQFAKLASKLGLNSEKSIKEILTYLSIINTAKNANLDELGKLAKLTGEQVEYDDNNGNVIETLVKIKRVADESGNSDK